MELEDPSKKILNAICYCKKSLISKPVELLMAQPCEHIFHKSCYLNDKLKTCPLCSADITHVFTSRQLKKYLKTHNDFSMYQKYADMVSMKNFDNFYNRPHGGKVMNVIDGVGIAAGFPFYSGVSDGMKICKDILCLMNSKLIVKGLKNIDTTKPRVYIANHTTYFDFVVIFYLLKCGFLSSATIKETWIGRQLMNIIKLLIIERGKSANTVDRMREYVKETGSICLFPEGMITHPDTIIRFRTGAFHIGYPIYPIVLRFDPIVYDNDIGKFMGKLITQPDLKIYVDILPVENPPFTPERIEEIRYSMAKTGNFAISRVSNKDVKD